MSLNEKLTGPVLGMQVVFESYHAIGDSGRVEKRWFWMRSYRHHEGRTDEYHFDEPDYETARRSARSHAREAYVPFTQVNRVAMDEALNTKAADAEYDRTQATTVSGV